MDQFLTRPSAAPKSKREFYERYLRGHFGNRPRTWKNWEELKASSYRGRVTIRDMQPGGPCHYGVQVCDLLAEKYPQGCDTLEGKRFNESMPDEDLVIQGNVWENPELQLEYSCEPNIGHRDAVRQPYVREASGTKAKLLLQTLLDPNSFDDVKELLNDYPGATVEFSAYRRPVGVLPDRGTVVWEVRLY